MAKKKSILKGVQEKEAAFNEKLVKPIEIGYDKDRAFTLTNAGSLTGAHLSEEMTDYIIQEAEKAGIDLQTAFGIAAAESTLGNPTDDKSAWNISSGIRRAFDNVYPGTAQHINTYGDVVNEQELLNFYYPLENQNPYTQQIAEADRQAKKGKDFELALIDGMNYADKLAQKPVPTGSVAQQAFEYFKQNGEGYAPGYKEQTGQSYVQHVRKKGKEALQSPEIQKAITNYTLKKIGRPKDYSFGTFDIKPAEWLKKAEGGPLNLKPWEGLSMRERAAYIRDAVSRGLNTVTDIRNDYNMYGGGGTKLRKKGSSTAQLKANFLKLFEESLKGYERYATPEWRTLLTLLVALEDGYYDPYIQNSIGAKGYFQLMPANRSATWTNPLLLFHEMYKLTDANMEYFKKNLTDRDLKLAASKGIDIYGLIAGAHLAGAGNTLNALRGGKNVRDKNNSSVLGYMTRFSQMSRKQPVSGDFKTVYFQPPMEETPEIEAPNPYVGYKLISLEDIDNLPLPSRIDDDEIAFEGTAPETIITPQPQKLYIQYTPKEIFDQMSNMITPYEPVELPKLTTATEILKLAEENRTSLLLQGLEDNIRSYILKDLTLNDTFAKGGSLSKKVNNTNKANLFYTGGKEESSELDWSPLSWFSLRVPKPDGTLYNLLEARILASHVPEYRDIERTAKANGTWLTMPDGSTWEGDPRSWVMMLSKAYKKNYSPQPWYTGQAEWPTTFDYPNDGKKAVKTNKMTRAPYYNGLMWFSNDKSYGDAFAYLYNSKGVGYRKNAPREQNIWGHNFLAAIPKRGVYRTLAAPAEGSADDWKDLPYVLKDNRIYRLPQSQQYTYGPRLDYNVKVNSRKEGESAKTDDVANWSRDLGDNGLFLHKVVDGSGIKVTSPDVMRRYNNNKPVKKSELEITYPVLEEFISQPGFTDKVKFIEGNTGDFDINNPYKYTYNFKEEPDILGSNYAAYGGNLFSGEDKDTIDVEGYPLVNSDSEGLTNWFNANPNVAGMAIGAGLNGISGDRRVVLNPNLKDSNTRNSVYMNESYRHYFDSNNVELPILTDVQRKAYKGTPYEGLDRKIQETEAARYLSGDPSNHLNDIQKAQLEKFRFTYPGGNIPEVTIYGNKKLLGGNLFSGEDEPTQQMNNGLNLYRNTNKAGDVWYTYQETPDSEEILLTPTNKRFSDDPTNWDYKDANGREYSPRMVNPTNSSTLEASEKMGPLEKYVAELNWRAKNDPASIALQGKYTMPAIASAWLAPLGEAFAGTTIAGVPATTWANTAMAAGFAGHGLNHAINEGVNDWGDAAMTALELAPLGGLARPMFNEAALAVENYRYPFGRPQIPENFLTIKPQVRTKVGDVEIDNPGLYYHQADAGKAENFVSTGRMRTPLEEYWLAKEEAGEKIPLVIRSGVKPGYPQDPGSAMFAQGHLWYGLTPNKPDLLVTAREMPIANKNASIMSNRASLRALEEQGSRRVTNDNIYTQGPHNRQNTTAYVWEPGYGYRRVSIESPTTIEWADAARTPQITAENAASNSGVMADAGDFSYKGLTSDMSDFFEKMAYSNKIHGKPMFPSDEGIGGFSKSVQVGIPETEYNELLHDVIGRNVREFRRAGLNDAQISNYIGNAKDAMDNVHIGMYSNSDYVKGGWEGFGGFYDSEGNFISVNTGSPLTKTKVVKHEGRHLLDHKVDDEILMPTSESFGKDFDSDMALSTMQKVKQNQNMILYDAYDNDFVTLPSKEGFNEGLEGYSNMDREAITTNLDSRKELLGSKADWDLDITDEIIDKMPDDAIFEAVEKANGYGRRYIRFLRENNKLTPEKAKQFREAMKHVGVAAVPVAAGAGLLFGLNNL